MPRCLHCNEPYADSLRRCPHCGAAPQEESSGGARPGEAPRRFASTASLRDRLPGRRAMLLVALGAVAVLGAVVAIPGSGPDPETMPASTGARPATRSVRPQPRVRQRGIRPGNLDKAVTVEEALLIGDQVLIRGTVAPNAVVRVTLDGGPVPLSADGSRFQVLLGRGKTSYELVMHGINREEKKEHVLVTLPEGEREAPIEPAHELDRQTFHEQKLDVELAPGSREASLSVVLDGVENLVRLGERVIRLYRAPEGMIFQRITETGHYAFLRLRDEQEVVLIPAGVSRRGSGDEPPHGPEHIVRMEAFLMDRTEVSCEQYSAFLEYMERVGDPSLRHREDEGTDLLPAGWTSYRCPAGSEELPVTGVSWYGAFAYARWVGGRLPTEAQWERAAAGPNGQRFPWGAEFEPGRCVVDAAGPVAARSMPRGAGPFDLLHASGNAREWCADRYDPRWLRYASRIDPRGPAGHRHRVVRGGSFASSAENLVLQFRDHEAPGNRKNDIGFRVATSWPDEVR